MSDASKISIFGAILALPVRYFAHVRKGNIQNIILSLYDGLFIYKIESDDEEIDGKVIQYPRLSIYKCINHIINFNSDYNFRRHYIKKVLFSSRTSY